MRCNLNFFILKKVHRFFLLPVFYVSRFVINLNLLEEEAKSVGFATKLFV